VRCEQQSDNGERCTDLADAPAIAIRGVGHPDALQPLLCDLSRQEDGHQRATARYRHTARTAANRVHLRPVMARRFSVRNDSGMTSKPNRKFSERQSRADQERSRRFVSPSRPPSVPGD